jgi:hypothetical protein
MAAIDLNHQGRLQGRAEILYAMQGHVPAKQWLSENPKGVIRGWDHATSVDVVTKLEGWGATKIMATGPVETYEDVPTTFGLVLTLPEDPAKRAAIFKWYHQQDRVIEAADMPPVREVGQKYMTVELKAD